MKKLIQFVFVSLFLYWLQPSSVLTDTPVVIQNSATMQKTEIIIDERVVKLGNFLEAYQSPLLNEATHFIAEADRLQLDWTLVAAISGVESTFGRNIPLNSYNAWGWGIFTGRQNGVYFNDWSDGITKVSEGLRYNYFDKGAQTIEDIGRIYAASPTWDQGVKYFRERIIKFTASKPEHLDFSI